jgi:hypothetical protein
MERCGRSPGQNYDYRKTNRPLGTFLKPSTVFLLQQRELPIGGSKRWANNLHVWSNVGTPGDLPRFG